MTKKLLIICVLLLFTTPAYSWQESLVDNGTSHYHRLKIKDLKTGKTSKIKYRIYGVRRDRVKIYNYETKEKKIHDKEVKGHEEKNNYTICTHRFYGFNGSERNSRGLQGSQDQRPMLDIKGDHE